VAQVKLVSQLLEEIPDMNISDAHHTAVVLSDENLLMPVLTSLPENMGDINITMGHPLKQTLVYSLIRHLMDLHTGAAISDGVVHFTSGNVISILKHPLLTGLLNESDNELVRKVARTNLSEISSDQFTKSETLSGIFKKISTPAELSGYFKDILSFIASDNERNNENDRNIFVQTSIRNEFIYRVVLSLNRLESIVNTPDVPFTLDTYIKILDRLLRMQSVPFSGEPLSGIQIMGILETRALDFKNLIILSVNEGILPAISSGSSFIPFSLREAFGLPSLNHQESIFAYHFYRLLQRAENVTFIYNSNSEGLRSGEMSRFLIQMKYEEALKPVFFDFNFEIKTPVASGERIAREKEHSEQLASLFLNRKIERSLSPSAINTWLNCRMKFFYRYVNRLKEPENISKDIDPAMLGNILHGIMKNLYSPFVGKELTGEIISGIIKDRQFLAKVINEELNNTYKSGRSVSISGNELIVTDVLMAYLNRILHADKLQVPFIILNLEDTFNFLLPFVSNRSELNVLIGGNIDRVDSGNRVTRIVDYKTGIVSESVKEINDLFTDDRKKDPDGWLQTLLYCEAYLAGNPESIVRPSIYKIKKLNSASTDDRLKINSGTRNDLPIDNYMDIREEFISGLKDLISIIFSNDEPFLKTKDRRSKCLYCPYRTLCMR
jgi:CRISPR/Cas system-associated exonuclease Cas4 (RecB family)